MIGIVERNNFLWQEKRMEASDYRHKVKYTVLFRPLFEKHGDEWIIPDSFRKELSFYPLGSAQVLKGMVNSSIETIRGNEPDSYYMDRTKGLYRIVSGKPVLKELPEHQLIFEEDDITSYTIMSGIRLNKSGRYSNSVLNDTERQVLLDSINARIFYFLKRRSGFSLDSLPPECDTVYVKQFLNRLRAPITEAMTVQQQPNGDKLVFLEWYRERSTSGSVFSLTHFREDNGYPLKLFCVVKADGSARIFFADMRLLEHADFDKDGKEEYLFVYSTHNHNGYILVYNDFEKSVSYTWSYH